MSPRGRCEALPGMLARRLQRAAVLAGMVATVHASAQNAFIDAARAPSAPAAGSAAAAVVRVFFDACVAHEGDSTQTVDWAINQGFDPIDARAGEGLALLSGRPGTVFAAPASHGGRMLLAIDLDKRCTVWAERSDGPAVRAEFSRAIGTLAVRGARVQPLQERSVERGGAWRTQLQWRYRRAGGAQDFAIGAVTTMTPQPAAQALSAAPIAPGASRPGL